MGFLRKSLNRFHTPSLGFGIAYQLLLLPFNKLDERQQSFIDEVQKLFGTQGFEAVTSAAVTLNSVGLGLLGASPRSRSCSVIKTPPPTGRGKRLHSLA